MPAYSSVFYQHFSAVGPIFRDNFGISYIMLPRVMRLILFDYSDDFGFHFTSIATLLLQAFLSPNAFLLSFASILDTIFLRHDARKCLFPDQPAGKQKYFRQLFRLQEHSLLSSLRFVMNARNYNFSPPISRPISKGNREFSRFFTNIRRSHHASAASFLAFSCGDIRYSTSDCFQSLHFIFAGASFALPVSSISYGEFHFLSISREEKARARPSVRTSFQLISLI